MRLKQRSARRKGREICQKLLHRRTHLLAPPAYESKIGLGSVGRDILCFLPELVLALGSGVLAGSFEADALRPNHFDGRVRN